MENRSVKYYLHKIFYLNVGYMLCSLGVTFILSANLGYGPWDVLSSGLSNTLGITIGQAVILISALLVGIEYALGTGIGIGTILNMLLIGLYIDLFRWTGLIDPGDGLVLRFVFLFLGMIILNFGIWLYMGQGLGSGPRDGLMVVLAKRFNLSVGVMKLINESVAVTIGYLLGGSFGVGTIVIAFLSGPILNKQFQLLKFDAKKVKHEVLTDYFKRKTES